MHWVIFALITICLGQPENSRKGKDHALFFAVTNYDEWEDLRNPIRDAEAIAKVLREDFDFTTEVVHNPTKEEILTKVYNYLSRKFEDDDQLMIFFTGHGEFNDLSRIGYFIPKDGKKTSDDPFHNSHLSLNYLKATISSIKCKHNLLVIDACYSGTLDQEVALGPWKSKQSQDRTWERPGVNPDNAKLQWITSELQKTSRLYITSGGNERTNDGVEHSPFAQGFLAALNGPELEDDILTFDELQASLTDGSISPKPRKGHFGQHEMDGNFLFIKKSIASELTDGSYADKQADLQNWDQAEKENTISSYQTYLNDPSNTTFREEAKMKLQELADDLDWNITQKKNTEQAYIEYLSDHPDGKYIGEAKSKIGNQNNTSREFDEMVLVPGGSFAMGDQFGDGNKDEIPVHQISVSDFYIGRYEVTNEEFSKFLNDEGNRIIEGKEYYDLDKGKAKIIQTEGRFSVADGFEKYPVVGVSWFGAVSFCNWMSVQNGLQPVYQINQGAVIVDWNKNGYRLPTEAEWEYAARSGGAKDKWAGTSLEASLKLFANHFGTGDRYFFTSAQAGSLKANDLGLYDMTGNAWEWCWDWYNDDYYEVSDGKIDPRGPLVGKKRVNRGGGWGSLAKKSTTTIRHKNNPNAQNKDLGFRLARNKK